MISHNIKTTDSWSEQHWSSHYSNCGEFDTDYLTQRQDQDQDPHGTCTPRWQWVPPQDNACQYTTKPAQELTEEMTKSLKCKHTLKIPQIKIWFSTHGTCLKEIMIRGGPIV